MQEYDYDFFSLLIRQERERELRQARLARAAREAAGRERRRPSRIRSLMGRLVPALRPRVAANRGGLTPPTWEPREVWPVRDLARTLDVRREAAAAPPAVSTRTADRQRAC
jgi:hypothetical protein